MKRYIGDVEINVSTSKSYTTVYVYIDAQYKNDCTTTQIYVRDKNVILGKSYACDDLYLSRFKKS